MMAIPFDIIEDAFLFENDRRKAALKEWCIENNINMKADG
jgi:hypothetical protein